MIMGWFSSADGKAAMARTEDGQSGEAAREGSLQCRAPGGCPCFDNGGVCDRSHAQCEELS